MTADQTVRPPQSGAEILARIKPTLRVEKANICLRPDLIADLDAADAELREHVESEVQSTRLAGKSGAASKEAQELAKAVQVIEDQIVEATIPFYFRALPKDKWLALTLRHPPRKGDQFDEFAGYNRDAAIDAAVRQCLIDPVFDDESWDALVAVCNVSEWAEMRRAVNVANGRGEAAPKSALASRVLSRRAASSKQPKTGA